MPKSIIAITGPIASGKDTVKNYICEKYSAKSYKFSQLFRDLLSRLYLDQNRENLQNISQDIRQRFGNDILAKVVSEDLKNSQDEIIVLDGARRLADLKFLWDLPEFSLISVDAKPQIRYERMKKRGENPGDREKTFSQFEMDDKKESEAEIPLVMEKANYNLDNNENLDKLYSQIEAVISKII